MERGSSPPLAALDTGEELQSSIELAPAAPCQETFSLQSLVSASSESASRPASQANKKLTFQQEVFKFSPMCYHPKRRRAVLTENSQPKPTDPAEIAKSKPPLRLKTVSFSTGLDKENHTPEDVELKDSLELEPQVPPDTPKTKATQGLKRGQSVGPAPRLIYCPACDLDTRTIVVYESLPVSGLKQLMCCWGGQRGQVLAAHKCVKCKRVIARLAQ